MFTARFTAYTESPAGRRQVVQTNNQNEAWGLAMVATRHAAQQQPTLQHVAILYDNVAGAQLATMPYKQSCLSK